MDGGVTRYRPSTSPPKVRIVSVRARKQVYTELDSIPPITVGNDITIEYGAIDFRTVPEKRQYRYQAFRKSLGKKEVDSDWSRPVKSERFEWTPEEPGTYTFEVQAIDRDLNYSEPASIEIDISPIPFYQTGIFLVLMYGTERLLDLVAGIDPAASAEDVIEAILEGVNGFVGAAEQYDDMTIVVVKKLGNNNAT